MPGGDASPWIVPALAAAALWTGHAAFKLGTNARPRESGLHLDEGVFVRLAFGLLLQTWLAVVLAEAGHFGAGQLLAASIIAAWILTVPGLFASRGDREIASTEAAGLAESEGGAGEGSAQRADRDADDLEGGRRPRRGRARRWLEVAGGVVVVAAIVAVGAHFYFPQFDVRLEARDPGVYHLAGVQLARTGTMTPRDDLVLSLSESDRRYFFPWPFRDTANESYRYIGFYLETRDGGRVIPQALPVLPVWIAVGFLAAGLAGALAAPAWAAIMAAVALFYVGRRLVGPAVGALAALLLASNFVQAWFARYAAAEVPAQLLVLIGAYGLVQFRRREEPFFGVMAAGGLGLAWMTKAELAILVVPLAALFLVDAARGRLRRPSAWALWGPLAILVVHSGVHAVGWLWPYYYDLLLQLGIGPMPFLALAVAGAAATLVVAAYLDGRLTNDGAVARALRGQGPVPRVLAGTLSVVLTAGLAYGLWLRPTKTPLSGDSRSMLELAWALSPAGLALALLGVVVALWNPKELRGAFAALGVLLFAALIPLIKRQVFPELPWAYRRWLAVVFPVAALMTSYAVWFVATRVRRWTEARLRVRAGHRPAAATGAATGPATGTESALAGAVALAVAVAMTLPVAATCWMRAEAFRDHVEMPGTATAIETLERIIEPGATVIFEPRTYRGLPRFEAALSIWSERGVIRLPEPEIAERHVTSVVWLAAREGHPCYLITTGYIDTLVHPRAIPVEEIVFETSRLRQRRWELPSPDDIERLRIVARVYRLETDGSLQPAAGRIDVGNWDDLYLGGRRFHEAEVDAGGTTFRWTSGDATFFLPGLPPGEVTIDLTADVDYPPELGEQEIGLVFDGKRVGALPARDGWRRYRWRITVPEYDASSYVPRVRISAATFRPVDYGLGENSRDLGIKVDSLAFAAAASGAE